MSKVYQMVMVSVSERELLDAVDAAESERGIKVEEAHWGPFENGVSELSYKAPGGCPIESAAYWWLQGIVPGIAIRGIESVKDDDCVGYTGSGHRFRVKVWVALSDIPKLEEALHDEH